DARFSFVHLALPALGNLWDRGHPFPPDACATAVGQASCLLRTDRRPRPVGGLVHALFDGKGCPSKLDSQNGRPTVRRCPYLAVVFSVTIEALGSREHVHMARHEIVPPLQGGMFY